MTGGERAVPGGGGPLRLAAISIDLDEARHHRRVHGVGTRAASHPAYDLAVPRAARFAAENGVPLTFFAVSDDLSRKENANALLRAVGSNHVVESHSASHPYDLVRLSRDEIRREVLGSFRDIERVTRRRPVGFRAPGYTLSDTVLDALEEAGAAFDSSVFPSPPYYAAKLGVLARMAMEGRPSASIVGSPRVVLAETEAYRPGAHWWKRGERGLVEVPIRVTRGPRLPVTGTTLALVRADGAKWLVRSCGTPPLFNLALHAIDFLEASDGLDDLVPHEVALRVPLAERERALLEVVCELRRKDYAFTTLGAAVEAVAARDTSLRTERRQRSEAP